MKNLFFKQNDIYEKDEKLKRYRRIGMKAVKDKENLQKIVDSWSDSLRNLHTLVKSGMSSTCKIGLGYEIKSYDELLSYEEEMGRVCFVSTGDDYPDQPNYNRFTKTNDFKGVPPPLSGDYTPLPTQEFDESLFVYGKKGPQSPELTSFDEKSSEYSTYQSNDSEGSIGTNSEPEPKCLPKQTSVPKTIRISKPTMTSPAQKNC